ncbi:MAG: TetR/AcrR family transcriptional regulator [Pseudomonadota bacterium]
MSDAAKTRTRKDAETRQAEIVAAAFKVFTRDGLAGAKVDAIAEEAKVSKGTVYVYYKTKEEVFKAVMMTYIQSALEKTMAGAIREDMGHEERLKAVIGGAYRLFAGSDIRKIITLLVGEGSRFPGLIKFYHDNVLMRGRMVIQTVVRAGVNDGVFRDIPVEEYPQIIMGPAMMGAIWAQHFHKYSPVNLDELYDAHIDLLLEGLRPRSD